VAGLGICLVLLLGVGAIVSLIKPDEPIPDMGDPGAGPVNPGPAAPVANAQLPADELKTIGQEFTAALNSGDVATAASRFDFTKMVDLTLSGVDLPQNVRNGFEQGFLMQARGQNGLIGNLAANIEPNGARFLRIVNDGQQRIQFRLANSDGTVVYAELIPERSALGTIRIVDMYLHTTGETMTQTLRRTTLPLRARSSPDILARLSGAEQEIMKAGPERQVGADPAGDDDLPAIASAVAER